jgi:hypothetical protein
MQRPRPITILAVLVLLMALSNLVTGILLITGKVSFEKAFGQVPELGDMQQSFEQTMKVVIVLISVLALAIAWGLWNVQNWARSTTRVFCVLGLLGALIQMIQAFTIKDAINFLFYAIIGGAYYWVFFYLGQPGARAAFKPAGPASQPTPPSDAGDGTPPLPPSSGS